MKATQRIPGKHPDDSKDDAMLEGTIAALKERREAAAATAEKPEQVEQKLDDK